MKRTINILFWALLLVSFSLGAQTKPAKIWATATFNKSEVQLGEPLLVTVTVYTSTWFTKPPIFEEIQIKGSLMAKLEQNGGARTAIIGKKRYPAIEQKFVVYPNIIGENVLPSFKVTTECPPEGGYKGVSREVFSKARSFTVLGPPEGIDPNKYLAANNLTVKDYWDTDLTKVKAGDVLERRITYNASGSLAATIPPTTIDSIDFGTVYAKTPILNNRQNSASFSGTRTEIYTYLLEKDGDFEIPEITIQWYKLSSRSLETEVIESVPLSIAENPDLEFILTRQKELQAELEATKEEEPEAKEPFSFMGLNWWQLLLVIVALVVVIRFLAKHITFFIARQKEKRQLELDSEEHYYKAFKHTVQQGHGKPKEVLQAFYSWYDRYRVNTLGPEGKELFDDEKDAELERDSQEALGQIYSGHPKGPKPNFKKLLGFISKKRSKPPRSVDETAVNPEHINP